jgi:hypothetical protein
MTVALNLSGATSADQNQEAVTVLAARFPMVGYLVTMTGVPTLTRP